MSEKNLKNFMSSEFLSEDSEDYTLDDIVQLHKVDDEVKASVRQPSAPLSSVSAIKIPKSVKALDNNLKLEDNEYNLNDIKNIEEVLKRISNILLSRITVNVNKFSKMTHSNILLKELYKNLENLSKNRGNPKEIIDIGSKIEVVEEERQKQFVNSEEISKTIEDINSINMVLSKFKAILESTPH